MKNLFITLSLIGLACLSVSAQFTTVPVKLWGDCMSANSNSRYRIKVEILNITTGNPAITPVVVNYNTEGFPTTVPVSVPIYQTACTPDGNTNIYKVIVSAAKYWVTDGHVECLGKADDQPEMTCYQLINVLPTYNSPTGILVHLE